MRFASVNFYFIAGETNSTSQQTLELLPSVQRRKLLALMVLPSQSRHHHGHELLKGGLNFWCELVSQLGGEDDGQALRQQL